MRLKWIKRVSVPFLGLYLLMTPCFALPLWGYDSGVVVQTVLKAKTAGNGQPVQYLKTDKPEVTAAVVEIAPGAETGWHLHKVPVYAYVMEGTLKVSLADGKEYTFEKGQAIIEVVDTAHNGRNVGKDTVKLIVFYTGEENKPNAVPVKR